MAQSESSPGLSAADLATLHARVDLLLAKQREVVRSWSGTSSHPRPPKTQEQLDAEDAELLRRSQAPPRLGVGATFEGDVKKNANHRRNELFGNDFLQRHLTRGKPSIEENGSNDKARVSKRSLQEESSDEEVGRSALGKAKKAKRGAVSVEKDTKGALMTGGNQKQLVIHNRSDNAGVVSDEAAVQKGTPHAAGTSTDQIQPPVSGVRLHIGPQSKPVASNPTPSSKVSKISTLPVNSDYTDVEMDDAKPSTLNAAGRTSSHETDAAEAKTVKNRLKKAKKKERERKKKEMAKGHNAEVSGAHDVVVDTEEVEAKKLKDKLLDADGN